jgi:hypothetical protein
MWSFTLDAGKSQTLNIVNLLGGKTCFYEVQSNGGAPAFSVSTTAVAGTYDVEWIEFGEDAINDSTYLAIAATDSTSTATLKASAPVKGMPPRDTRFSDGLGSA